jgi:serine/threonine-protein kinase
MQVAAALATAHSAGIVHRDVKPENIMLRPDGYVKVLDFGIAKLAEQETPPSVATESFEVIETNLGSIIGTVRYMSPEQARGARVDKRTDIWSLGVVLYEMIAGCAPFTGNTPREVITSVLGKDPPLSNYIAKAPSELQQIVTKALQKDPAQRYQSADEMFEALKGLRRKLDLSAELEHSVTTGRWLRWARSPIGVAIVFLVGVLMIALPFYRFRNQTNSAPEKSIAVLPFENLSDDKQNSYFADGVQDEILTDLAKVADLKVITRTSVMQYKSGIARNLRQIGQQLGVAHVVEGSVQRSGNRVRVNAQLIDARTDRHLWGQTYDRDLSDVFAIQNEIAKTIADQLQANLSPTEKIAIERLPTSDITAFDLYTRAKNLTLPASFNNAEQKELLEQVDLLIEAIRRDSSFFEAYCLLTWSHDQLYFYGFDHTPARLALADAAIHAALRLRPDAGEAHLARAENLYRGYRDYYGALAQLEVARQTLPNDARIFQLMGFIQRRQGRWQESTRSLERAVDLDPRGTFTLQQMAWHYVYLRHYAQAKPLLARVLAIEPMHVGTEVLLASIDFRWKADPGPLHRMIDSIHSANPAAVPSIVEAWLPSALAERDPGAARDALNALGETSINLGGDVYFTRAFIEGVIARMTKDEDKARSAFTAARAEQEKIVNAQPNFAPALCALGLIDAALGRKEEALREGRRAVELLPVEKDAEQQMVSYLAMIAAWADDKDLACEQLAIAIHQPDPGNLSYGELQLSPFWDPLRGDPRFEKIVASLAPKEAR